MKYLKHYRTFEEKKHKLKRFSDEQYKKEIEKNDGKQPNDRQPVTSNKTD